MLEHLQRTLQTCIDYHIKKDNPVTVAQLTEHLQTASTTSLDSTTLTPALYHDQAKK